MIRNMTSIFVIIFLLIFFSTIVLCSDKNSSKNSSSDELEDIDNDSQEFNNDPVNTELGKKINYPDLKEVINGLTPELKQYLSNKLYQYSVREPITIEGHEGSTFGNKNALYHIKEFSDFNCSHCKELAMILAYLGSVSENNFYIESFQFPLDTECNPIVQEDHINNGNGSCEMARAVICAGRQNAYYDFKFSLFSNNVIEDYEERIELAIEESEIDKKKFDECLLSTYPGEKLRQDVELGMKLGIEGTPYLIWNDKKLSSNRLVIVAMLLSYSNPNHSLFKELLPSPEINKIEKK